MSSEESELSCLDTASSVTGAMLDIYSVKEVGSESGTWGSTVANEWTEILALDTHVAGDVAEAIYPAIG